MKTKLIIAFICFSCLWSIGIKPIMAEWYFTQFNRSEGAKYQIIKAVSKGRVRPQDIRSKIDELDADSEKYIQNAIYLDPCSTYFNTASHFYMGRDPVKAHHLATQAIDSFNGDQIPWVLWFQKGLTAYRQGNILEAKVDYEKALYYWPLFKSAKKNLEQIEDIIKKHDRITIKIR